MDGSRLRDEILAIWKAGRHVGRITTSGRSMEPLLEQGDEVEVRYGHPEPRFGDLVVFANDSGLITHRVIGQRVEGATRFYLEKGDRSSRASFIPAATIHGKVIRIFKKGRTIHLESRRSIIVGKTIAVYSLCAYWILNAGAPGRPPESVSRLSTAILRFFSVLFTRGKRQP